MARLPHMIHSVKIQRVLFKNHHAMQATLRADIYAIQTYVVV